MNEIQIYKARLETADKTRRWTQMMKKKNTPSRLTTHLAKTKILPKPQRERRDYMDKWKLHKNQYFQQQQVLK